MKRQPLLVYFLTAFALFWGCIALGFAESFGFWAPMLGALAPAVSALWSPASPRASPRYGRSCAAWENGGCRLGGTEWYSACPSPRGYFLWEWPLYSARRMPHRPTAWSNFARWGRCSGWPTFSRLPRRSGGGALRSPVYSLLAPLSRRA